jgi:hypothetical protein
MPRARQPRRRREPSSDEESSDSEPSAPSEASDASEQSAPSEAELPALPPIAPGGAVFDIQRFDCRKIRPNSTILIAGNRRTGKSTMGRAIINDIKSRFYQLIVYTATYDDDADWTRATPAKFVHHCPEHFDSESLVADLRCQLTRKAIAKRHHAEKMLPPTLFLFEDTEALKKPSIWQTPGVRSLAFNGRHYAAYAVFLIQYIMAIPKEFRSAFDYAILMFEKNTSIKETLYEQFAGVFPNFRTFESVFDSLTENHGAMVIDLRALSRKISDNVFYYRVANKDVFPTHVGHSDLWDPRIDAANRARSTRTSARPAASIATGPGPARGRGPVVPRCGCELAANAGTAAAQRAAGRGRGPAHPAEG